MKDFTHFGVKRRSFPEYNYNAVWSNLKTIRTGEGVAKELPADRPEFFDVGVNTKCNLNCHFCLTPETQISTNEGKEYIPNIKVGDLVFSYNELNGNIELKIVDQIFERDYEGEIIEVVTEIGTLKLTPNHKIFTRNRGWIEAGNLQMSDELLDF